MRFSAPWAHEIVPTDTFYVPHLAAFVALQGLRYVGPDWMADVANFDV